MDVSPEGQAVVKKPANSGMVGHIAWMTLSGMTLLSSSKDVRSFRHKHQVCKWIFKNLIRWKPKETIVLVTQISLMTTDPDPHANSCL